MSFNNGSDIPKAAAEDVELEDAKDNNEEVAPNYNHQCYICDKTFSANSNLNRHLRKIHKENVQSPYNNVKCALCDSIYSSSSIYNQHLENDHRVHIEVERLTFATKESFEEWKYNVEQETTSQYIKSRGEKKSKNLNKTYYSCNRSGYYVSKARTRKALKKQGSRKINGRCPASMNVTVNKDSTYDVKFVKTHVGHNFDVKHLDLSLKDRDFIVQKLEAGITKREIIKQIRSSIEQHGAVTTSLSPSSTNGQTTVATCNTVCAGVSNIISESEVETHQINNHLNIEVVPNSSTEIAVVSSKVDTTPSCQVSVTSGIPRQGTHDSASADLKSDRPHQATPNSKSSREIGTAINGDNIILSSTSHVPTSRLHLATTKDIHNIINSKHLDSKLIRHNYDLNNLDAWIEEMKEFEESSCVLLYKHQGDLIPEYPSLREDDFMLVIMKEGQADVFKSHGDKCITIDSTHNIHCEYLQVAYLSVIDDDCKGFPVAFLFSTRTDLETLRVFFSVLREKIGKISTRTFIADELDDFYQAWTDVMTRPTHNLVTPWSVFDCWSKKFELITNRDKLRRVKKLLRHLLIESEEEKFRTALNQMVSDYRNHQDTDKFIRYFEENYANNSDPWSSCFRKVYGASNFQLWKLHDKFKLVYKEGKNSKKLCKFITGMMTLFEHQQLERLVNLDNTKSVVKRKALADRHKKSVETSSLVYEVAVEPVYWLSPSETSNEIYYEIRRAEAQARPKEPRCCDLVCQDCCACRHLYKCTCLDYNVNLNMCKHIHRICEMCKST